MSLTIADKLAQFHTMIGHNHQVSHQHILGYLLASFVDQEIMPGVIYQMSDQKEDLKGLMFC